MRIKLTQLLDGLCIQLCVAHNVIIIMFSAVCLWEKKQRCSVMRDDYVITRTLLLASV